MIQHILILIFGTMYNKSTKYTCAECGHEGTGLKAVNIKFIALYIILAIAGGIFKPSLLWILFVIGATVLHTILAKPRCRTCYSTKLVPSIITEIEQDEK